MSSEKVTVKILEKRGGVVKLKFPFLEVPVEVSQRYFQKIKQSRKYEVRIKKDDFA